MSAPIHDPPQSPPSVPATDRADEDADDPYSALRTTLKAEINAAFCCASLGIVPTVRHADYLGVWLDVLREDCRAIFRAASQAAKAADFVLSGKRENAPEQREAAA